MESIARLSGWEVFATSTDLKVFGKRKNYLKIHYYLTGVGFGTIRVSVSTIVAGVTEQLGTFVLTVKRDNHLNNGGIYDNFVIFDIRDIVNSVSEYNGKISFAFAGGVTATLQTSSTALGFNLVDQQKLKTIPFRSGDYPFYLPQTYWRYFATASGVVVPLTKETDISELFQTYGIGVIVRDAPANVRVSPFVEAFTAQFGSGVRNLTPSLLLIEDLECSKDYELVQWTGSEGFKKSWFFEVKDRQVYTSETVKLFDYERNNKYLKDANMRVTLQVDDADYATRCYLADIVQADDVESVNTSGTGAWNTSILVETESLSIGEVGSLSNVILTANFERYDRI